LQIKLFLSSFSKFSEKIKCRTPPVALMLLLLQAKKTPCQARSKLTAEVHEQAQESAVSLVAKMCGFHPTKWVNFNLLVAC
jgi:hypothetical protein